MLQAPYTNRFEFEYTNVFSATTGLGIGSLNCGSLNTKGSYMVIGSAAQISQDIWEFELHLSRNHFTAVANNAMLDIGVDPAGGTSYTNVISGLICGGAGDSSDGGYNYYFPLRISSGSTIAVRGQRMYASSMPPMAVAIWARGKPSHPDVARVGQYVDTINSSTTMVTSTIATSIVPGNTGADGAWTLIGATKKPLWAFQVGIQTRDAAVAATPLLIDVSAGDVTNKKIISKGIKFAHVGNAERNTLLAHRIYANVASGTNMYARASVPGTAETLYDLAIYGVGG